MVWRIDFPPAPRLFWAEVCVRCILITVFVVTEELPPFQRIIQPEEYWLYRYPQTASYITTGMLYALAISAVVLVVVVFFPKHRSFLELWAGLLVPSLALPMTGVVTNSIKLTVGRPRPDWFDRCYPGVKNFDATQPCTQGDADILVEGRKSFPSGHSSITFCSMGFVALYIAGQLGVFNNRGRGHAWRLCLAIAPLVLAAVGAISRTMDYHHHWQDITVGGILGLLISYLVYRQYFPSLVCPTSHTPFLASGSGYPGYPGAPNAATPLLRSAFSQPTGLNAGMKSV